MWLVVENRSEWLKLESHVKFGGLFAIFQAVSSMLRCGRYQGKDVTMKMMHFSKMALLLSVGTLASCERYLEQPSCHQYFQPGDMGHYSVDDRGVVVDKNSGTRWYRCQAGERLSGGRCVGRALELSQADALQYAKEFSEASGRSWRLPTVREMASLKQDKCHKPSVNTQVFNTVQISNYWTSSSSPNGAYFGCTSYTFNGHDFCREPASNERPFLLVLE
jgi:hypothetical protein